MTTDLARSDLVPQLGELVEIITPTAGGMSVLHNTTPYVGMVAHVTSRHLRAFDGQVARIHFWVPTANKSLTVICWGAPLQIKNRWRYV